MSTPFTPKPIEPPSTPTLESNIQALTDKINNNFIATQNAVFFRIQDSINTIASSKTVTPAQFWTAKGTLGVNYVKGLEAGITFLVSCGVNIPTEWQSLGLTVNSDGSVTTTPSLSSK